MSHITTPKSLWLEQLMSGIHDATVMLSRVVAFGALKYGVVIEPSQYLPGTESPYEIITRISVCVDGDEEAPFLFIFINHIGLEGADDAAKIAFLMITLR